MSADLYKLDFQLRRRKKKVARCEASGIKCQNRIRVEDAKRKEMPSSHVSSNFHLVFSTKERLPLITIEWRERLHAYLGGIVKGMEAVPLAVGGGADHVHLPVSLKSKHRLDYLLRDLKADSSAWVHNHLKEKFEWQKGYGAFSVSLSNIDAVKRYVANQEKHHQKKTFQVEYIDLLNAAGLNMTRNICGENVYRMLIPQKKAVKPRYDNSRM